MTEILDVLANIVLLPYYMMKATLMFILANIIMVIVLISIIMVILIILVAIFPTVFIKILFGIVGLMTGIFLAGLIVAFTAGSLSIVAAPITAPLAIVSLIVLIILSFTGIGLFLIRKFTLIRLITAILIGPIAGMLLLGWVIGEYIEDSIRRPEFDEFAQHIQGTLTAYDGKGSSDRHRAAIAIKPGSKYYGLALSMTEKEDINKTDSGKFWITQEIPNTIFLFNPAYDNLNTGAFYQ